jgi:hypothetical protein
MKVDCQLLCCLWAHGPTSRLAGDLSCCIEPLYMVTSLSLHHAHGWSCQEDISEEVLTARMRSLLQPFLLRRLKEQVASQLVPKQQEVRNTLP